MKILINGDNPQFKSNLHAHSTVSDGAYTPSELRAVYSDRGYSVLCLTDHDILVGHEELSDGDFLFLRGYELSFTDAGRSTPFSPTCHLSMIARDPSVTRTVRIDPTADPAEEPLCDYYSVTVPGGYSPDTVNRVIALAHEEGYFTVLAHPDWSLERPEDYRQYSGLGGVEIYNHKSRQSGTRDDSPAPYELLLREGQYILPIASDDNHNTAPLYAPGSDSFGGWQMISAPSLTYGAVIEALEAGNAYASTGPAIYSMHSDCGCVVLHTSAAVEAALYFDGRPRLCRDFAPSGSTATDFTIELPPDYTWFRIEVTDAEGHKAYTRAYLRCEA